MKRTLILLLLLPFAGFSQTNKPCDVDQVIPRWVALNEFIDPTGTLKNNPFHREPYNIAKMKPNLAASLQWIQSYTDGIRGAQRFSWYNNFYPGNPHPDAVETDYWYQSTGLLGNYYLRIMSAYLFCENEKLHAYDHPAWIEIRFNHFNHFAKPIYVFNNENKGVLLKIDGKVVWEVPQLKSSASGVDYYDFPGDIPESVVSTSFWFYKAFVVRKNDKPLFIPLTRKAYMEHYLDEMEKYYLAIRKMKQQYTQVTPPEEIDREMEERIAEIKKLTEQGAWGYSRENLEQRIALTKENYRQRKLDEANKLENIALQDDNNFKESKKLIQEYLQKTSMETLSKKVNYVSPHFLYDPLSVKLLISNLSDDYRKDLWPPNNEIMLLNNDYFDNSLAPDVPQLITVEFINNVNVHQHLNLIAARMLERNDFTALQNMLKQK